ncbi:diguanylate cyclase [bacterium]|nr:diguanylate cyclase [bacterium]
MRHELLSNAAFLASYARRTRVLVPVSVFALVLLLAFLAFNATHKALERQSFSIWTRETAAVARTAEAFLQKSVRDEVRQVAERLQTTDSSLPATDPAPASLGPHGAICRIGPEGVIVESSAEGGHFERLLARSIQIEPEVQGNGGFLETAWRVPGKAEMRSALIYVTSPDKRGRRAAAAGFLHEIIAELDVPELSRAERPFIVYDETGRTRHQAPGSEAGIPAEPSSLSPQEMSNIREKGEGYVAMETGDRAIGKASCEGFFFFHHLPGLGWTVATVIPKGSLVPPTLHGLRSSLRRTSGGLLAFCAVVLGAGALFLSVRTRKLQSRTPLIVAEQVGLRTEELQNQTRALQKEQSSSRKNIERLESANRDLSNWVDSLKQTSREIQLLNQMGDLLQACRTLEETDRVIVQLARELFPNDSGALCRYNDSQNVFETVIIWGDPQVEEGDFLMEDCWALRRGKEHEVDNPDGELTCRHVSGTPPQGYICLPMMAQGELLGLLHLQWGPTETSLPEEARANQLEAKKRLASTVREQFSLALANLKLREMLRVQSIRDQLTGLYNRRHMEDSLAREMHRARRREKPMGIIMLDVDHFKRFNDTYGHEDGDILLRELGALLQANVRLEDIACRYGGEEFIVILPDAPIEIVARRAEVLRKRVADGLKIKQDPVTVSVGVSVFPDHGLTAEAVVSAADQALYQAKKQGRNQVVVCQPRNSEEVIEKQ